MAQVDITGIQHYTQGIGHPKADVVSQPPVEWSDLTGTALVKPDGSTIALGAVGGLPAYLGQVATRCQYNTRRDSGNTQAMLRQFLFAREDISSGNPMYLRWDDKYSTAELSSGATTTLECAVEYPSGTYTRVTFSGSNQGTFASGGTLISDAISVTIPDGAMFWLRTYRTNPNGLIAAEYNPSWSTVYGEAVNVGSTGIANVVMGGAITSNGFFLSTPTAVLAMTRKVSVLLVGDSRVVGYNDATQQSLTGDAGEFSRSIGGNFGYINTAMTAQSGASFAGGNGVFRSSLKQYCSHVFCNHGINDLGSGTLLPAMQTMYGNLWALLGAPIKPVYQATLPPNTTSSDSWATVGNQTPAAWESVRLATNDWIRGQGETKLSGVFDITRAIESSQDSGLWKAPGYTVDGLHETIKACFAIVSSGVINPALIVRR